MEDKLKYLFDKLECICDDETIGIRDRISALKVYSDMLPKPDKESLTIQQNVINTDIGKLTDKEKITFLELMKKMDRK